SNQVVSEISSILGKEHTYKTQTLKPVSHEVVWDAELSAAAAWVLAAMLEWPRLDLADAKTHTLGLVAAYSRLKAATDGTKSAKDLARQFAEAVGAVMIGGKIRIKAAREVADAVAAGIELVGDPVADWRSAVRVMGQVPALAEIQRQVRL